ncbi:MAG: prepilin peptidase, partial [Synechococcus sp.]|nr:prepilin peptidase [Synechococcus sp.]
MMLLALLLGLCIGSFLNVVVWRLPRGESVVWPGSHCPRCGHDLPWTNNIPVLSWVLLRGQCQFCHGPISVQYPLIELLSGGLWVLLAQPGVGRFGPLDPFPNLLAGGLLLSLLLPLALIDLRTMRLPEPLCRW